MTPARFRMVWPTRLTWFAAAAILSTIVVSGLYLMSRYASLPDILPVHFSRANRANGWQYKTYARVLAPVVVQAALAVVFGVVAALLLSRPHGSHDEDVSDIRAASAASEAVAFFALIWVTFQGYAAFALVAMWQRGRGGLGEWYTTVMLAGVVLSGLVAVRAHGQLGRPTPREFVPGHWRFGQLYKNPSDPALFVPTRDGSRWTLNFGRPVAVALMGLVLAVGIVVPTVILGLLLR